eukprot:3547784-Rhodomonas_salina.2
MPLPTSEVGLSQVFHRTAGLGEVHWSQDLRARSWDDAPVHHRSRPRQLAVEVCAHVVHVAALPGAAASRATGTLGAAHGCATPPPRDGHHRDFQSWVAVRT